MAQLLACGIPLNGGTPGTPPPPPPPPPLNVAPTAAITTSCVARACTFNVTASDTDGTIQSILLSRGDGSAPVAIASAPATVTYTYPATATGLITPSVTVTDNGGNPGPITVTANSNAVMPTATAAEQITAAFTAACVGTRCTVDASGSHADLAGFGARITGYEWVYRVTGTTEQLPFGAGNRTAVLANLPVGSTYQVRVKLTDSRGATKWSTWATGANALTPIKLTVTKATGPTNVAANRRTTIAWEGPTTGQLAIFEGTDPNALNPTPLVTRAASLGSYLAVAIPVGTPRYYQVCLVSNPSMCSPVSAQVMYF